MTIPWGDGKNSTVGLHVKNSSAREESIWNNTIWNNYNAAAKDGHGDHGFIVRGIGPAACGFGKDCPGERMEWACGFVHEWTLKVDEHGAMQLVRPDMDHLPGYCHGLSPPPPPLAPPPSSVVV